MTGSLGRLLFAKHKVISDGYILKDRGRIVKLEL